MIKLYDILPGLLNSNCKINIQYHGDESISDIQDYAKAVGYNPSINPDKIDDANLLIIESDDFGSLYLQYQDSPIMLIVKSNSRNMVNFYTHVDC